MCAHRFINIT
jgi:hypothetical protein